MTRRKSPPEFQEGSEAVWRFQHGLTRILTVSKEELARREKEYQESLGHKPKRGPKPKK